jgi:uncharacterized protein
MSHAVLSDVISQVLQWDRPKANFVWHGGEPLLATIGFYRVAVKLQERLNSERPRQVSNSIQTNGILLNDEWAEFFAHNKFAVGVSVDGPQQIHDRQRVTRSGKGTYSKVMRGVESLRHARINPGVVCVVHQDNVNEPEAVYEGLLDAGFHYFHFKAMYDYSHGVLTADSISGEQYASFLLRIFRRWATADNAKIEIGNFTSILTGLMGGRPHLCEHAGECTSLITIDWDGRIGPCDAFPKGTFDFGNVRSTGLHQYRQAPDFLKLRAGMTTAQTECQGCEFFKVCAGGCFKYSYNPITEMWGHSAYCSSKKILFKELLEYARTGEVKNVEDQAKQSDLVKLHRTIRTLPVIRS